MFSKVFEMGKDLSRLTVDKFSELKNEAKYKINDYKEDLAEVRVERKIAKINRLHDEVLDYYMGEAEDVEMEECDCEGCDCEEAGIENRIYSIEEMLDPTVLDEIFAAFHNEEMPEVEEVDEHESLRESLERLSRLPRSVEFVREVEDEVEEELEEDEPLLPFTQTLKELLKEAGLDVNDNVIRRFIKDNEEGIEKVNNRFVASSAIIKEAFDKLKKEFKN